VQAAVAQILEAIYEPRLRKCSYGFRPQRNTMQALRQVAQAYRAGATWVIEGDLVTCFGAPGEARRFQRVQFLPRQGPSQPTGNRVLGSWR
jgi:RNA-directed DNA polymerase